MVEKDYIDRYSLMKKVHTGMNIIEAMQAIIDAPAADVVLRSCFDRILAENDDMREQLKSVGKLPGDDMSDLEVVRHGRWERVDYGNGLYNYHCSSCRHIPRENIRSNYCPNCGAKMTEDHHEQKE